jgi:hypothetical protein
MPSYSYQWEKLRDLLREPNVRELIAEHWEESGVDKDECPLAIDWDRYILLEYEGKFRVLTARKDGALVGYMSWFLERPPDYKTTLHGIQGPWNRAGLLAPSLVALKELGVKRVVGHDKLHVAASRGSLAPAFERAGFRETERVWYKVL